MAIGHWLKNFTKWYFDPDIEGGSGEGGGSSDFRTAPVTVINNASGEVTFDGALYIVEDEDFLLPNLTVTGGETITCTAVLYKNEAHWFVSDHVVAAVGYATTQTSPFGGTEIIITGDCTITIS